MHMRPLAAASLVLLLVAAFASLACEGRAPGSAAVVHAAENISPLGSLVAQPDMTWEPLWTGKQDAVSGATPTSPPPEAAQDTEGRRGRGARGRQEGEGQGEDEGEKKPSRPKKKRPGIAITSELVKAKCVTCHQLNEEDGTMGRISFMRKTPESWELSLQRMLRHKHVELTVEEAREIVRYFADHHGLARAEAELAMYEAERRVHWSEAQEDEDLRVTCGECHTLGRVLSQYRDAEEWKLLKATHLAFFPLADFQAFRGGRRGGGGGGDFSRFQAMSDSEREAAMEEMNRAPSKDRADTVLDALAKRQPLFSDDWSQWEDNRREVPVAGTWTVVGHEIGRGDVRGHVTIERTGVDTYDTEWNLRHGNEALVVRTGKGLLEAGYSWRGKSETLATGEAPVLREVLLLSDDWNTLHGRMYTGEYNELGLDITLHRRSDQTRIFAIESAQLVIPSKGNEIELLGTGFPSRLPAEDFHVGAGVTVQSVERLSAERVRLVLDVARGADAGRRMISFGAHRGPDDILLYDTIDYIRVEPGEGFSRIGGTMRPPQYERFEAVAMNRGPDDKPYTDDDVRIEVVPAKWHMEEFPIRENDDDAQFVGTLDADTGFFSPGLDGPNPERRWSANNIGDVYIVATCTLTVQELPEKPEKKADEEEADEEEASEEEASEEEASEEEASEEEANEEEANEEEANEEEANEEEANEEEANEPAPIDPDAPAIMVSKDFRARGHHLVTVPLYRRWDKFIWDQK